LFSVVTLVIAATGQYAAIAFNMRRRTRDFGVRIAVGASSHQILRAVLREGLVLTVCGLSIGFALSLATGRAISGFLTGVTATDYTTFAGVFVVLTAASLCACYLPALRASRVDPMQALREN
jgi:ABC-type antimicrobial peptide transport system permease subunit